jgi:hypothetical protein
MGFCGVPTPRQRASRRRQTQRTLHPHARTRVSHAETLARSTQARGLGETSHVALTLVLGRWIARSATGRERKGTEARRNFLGLWRARLAGFSRCRPQMWSEKSNLRVSVPLLFRLLQGIWTEQPRPDSARPRMSRSRSCCGSRGALRAEKERHGGTEEFLGGVGARVLPVPRLASRRQSRPKRIRFSVSPCLSCSGSSRA